MNLTSITPPATIGLIGGGQLGLMFTIKAREMGYKVALLEPDLYAPARDFANFYIEANYVDIDALKKLAEISDVITTEFENVPANTLKYLARFKPVYPNFEAIEICQNRLKEKSFFNSINIPTVAYYSIKSISDIKLVQNDFFPAILKTITMGYDGKGQIRIQSKNQLINAFTDLGSTECILEQMVSLKSEVSVIIARNLSETTVYPVTENIHKNGILDISIAPARLDDSLSIHLQQLARKIIDNLNYIGVLTIEFFITNNNKILANEMAPRPHNSGHHTIESCITSQFEQQIRSVCNLKLGNSSINSPSVMLNILGDIYPEMNPPSWNTILNKYDNAKLHLYGKVIAKPGRKMGHLTLLGNNINKLLEQAEEIKIAYMRK